ncbi:CTC-interacting domain 9 [Perilla frutescens var. hirtella]|uniref:CTC-interacting domain 9 n=1 Tax=Perilla frutescens var. hirtella TaxID=608512 RepID=A0AAD4PEC7_PERFH|nr:CTC-interacting domain 9 [Perilla frutescens var. hirtella]KAH6837249.1 CTC-interacting domain 9 [Perilla frutescens var. hirtella]
MAADAEVSGEAAVVKMESPAAAVEPSSPKNTIPSPTTENNVEIFGNSNSENSGESDGVKDSGLNPNVDSKSELQMKEIVDMLKKLELNPSAKEFFPSSYSYQSQNGAYNVPINKTFGNDGFPNQRRRRNNHNQGVKKRMSGRAFKAQREESIKRTVYVSDIDHNITEEQLAALFSSFGQVADCRVCGDPHSHLRFAFVEFCDEYSARAALVLNGIQLGFSAVKVLPSKTAILPVNPTFLPQSEDEREMCARTVYCTNIDKKVSQADVKIFFEARCGVVSRLRLLGDHLHSTRIAFVEFVMAESALLALDCCGEVLGSQRIRISPSKTPVRPRVPRPGMQESN